jgi:hypothetical protein
MSTKTNELQPFTFANGTKIMTRSVSVMLSMELHKAFPAPRPPKQTVTLADGVTAVEENPSDPDYLVEYQAYQLAQEERVQKLLIKRGAVVEWDDAKRAQVADLRSFWHDEFDKQLDPDDLMVYISHICIGPQEDMQKLVNKILRQSQPTEEAISEAQDSFPSEV